MKKIPMRKCLVTLESLPKKDLLRIVKTPEGELKVDPSGKLNGRGAYIKKDLEVLALAKKKKTLERAFEMAVPETLYEAITAFIK